MKKNMGSADRVLRIVLAAIVGVLSALNIISGSTAIILGILAIVFVVTSFVSFCPLYLPLGISTIKNKD